MQRFRQPHWGRMGWTLVILSVLCLATVVVILFSRVIKSDQGPLEPLQTPTSVAIAETPEIVATPATPASTFDPDPPPLRGSLPDLLHYVPDRLGDGSLPLSDIAVYADIQQWMSARGVALPDEPAAEDYARWSAELDNLAIPEVLRTRGMDEAWIETYGFNLYDVHQVLAVGSAPDLVMVFRGDFDADALHATWVANGYQAVRVEGVTIWSLYPGDSVDLSAPASRPALGNLNNIVLLDDGTLIATSRLSRLQRTVRVIHAQEPSLAENADIGHILVRGSDPEEFVTAILMKGSVLETGPVPTPVATPGTTRATPVANEPLPQAKLLMAGLQRPHDGRDARLVIIASFDDPAQATRAMARAEAEISQGVSTYTHLPFADQIGIGSMRVVATPDAEALLVMHLRLVGADHTWLDIIEHRDLGFISWPREP